MQSILDGINEWIKEILIGAINGNLSTMFGDVNEKVGTIAAEVGQTPQGWNANIFSMIQTLSENVIVPIAGLVITYVLCYELISMVTEKNNMHDVDTSMFFKWVFKAFVAVYLVTHTFDITMAVFDMAQHVVSGAAGVIGGSTEIDVAAALASMQSGLDAMEIPELLLAACQGQGGDFQSEAAKIRPDLDADNPHIIRAGKGHRLTFALITLMGSYSNTKPRERRFSLGVCTRTQRLIQSQDKSSVQPYQTADCMFCGGSPVRLAAFLSAQRQHRHKPCVYGYDCRHAALFPLCHV